MKGLEQILSVSDLSPEMLREEVSPEKAAEFLQVSHQYLARLLDHGEIPFYVAGRVRQITMSDLIEYKRKRKMKSKEALQRMTELSEEMGLYDE